MRWTFFQQLVISTKERLMSMPLASKRTDRTSTAGRPSALTLAFTCRSRLSEEYPPSGSTGTPISSNHAWMSPASAFFSAPSHNATGCPAVRSTRYCSASA
ncbi:hypothetical protein [Streptomyces sp. NPDC007856]|uniref:hypothetical protein n=1 Tax=Streptomyces sp. NPDC007856 TaxID=3364781 RepID=UPI0036922E3A